MIQVPFFVSIYYEGLVKLLIKSKAYLGLGSFNVNQRTIRAVDAEPIVVVLTLLSYPRLFINAPILCLRPIHPILRWLLGTHILCIIEWRCESRMRLWEES